MCELVFCCSESYVARNVSYIGPLGYSVLSMSKWIKVVDVNIAL